MSQSILKFRNGVLFIELPDDDIDSDPYFKGQWEWVRTDLDDVNEDVFQPFPDNLPPNCPDGNKTPSFSSRYRSQCRLVNLHGFLAVKRIRANHFDLRDSIETLAANDTGNHQGSRTSFLAIPAEVRLSIYRYLLITNRLPIVCPDPSGLRLLGPENYSLPYSVYPEILATCRQIHEEGSQVLYGENLFHRQFLWRCAWRKSGRNPWPRLESSPLKAYNRQHIRRVCLFRGSHLWFRNNSLKVLQDFPSLRELQVLIDFADVEDLGTHLTRIMRAVRNHQGPILFDARIGLEGDAAYCAWCERCGSGPLDFSLHRAKMTQLETRLKQEGLALDRELDWRFMTQASGWSDPTCKIGFSFRSGEHATRSDTIQCRITSQDGTELTLEPA